MSDRPAHHGREHPKQVRSRNSPTRSSYGTTNSPSTSPSRPAATTNTAVLAAVRCPAGRGHGGDVRPHRCPRRARRPYEFQAAG